MRKGGVEPPKPCGYRILSPARLPVPPLSRGLSRIPASVPEPPQSNMRAATMRATGAAMRVDSASAPTRCRVLPSASKMTSPTSDANGRLDLYHGLFRWHTGGDGRPRVSRHAARPASIPCPTTGRPLHVSTLDAGAMAICPDCANHGQGGFVSFVSDLRMAYACPECRQLVWLQGA